jgi:exonuclease VII small subunit
MVERLPRAAEGSAGAFERSAGSVERSAGLIERSAGSVERSVESFERSVESFERSAGSVERSAESFERSSITFERSAGSLERSAESLERSAESFERSAQAVLWESGGRVDRGRSHGRDARVTGERVLSVLWGLCGGDGGRWPSYRGRCGADYWTGTSSLRILVPVSSLRPVRTVVWGVGGMVGKR